MVRIICLSNIIKEVPETTNGSFFKIMTQNRITSLDKEYLTSKKIQNSSETFGTYELTELCIGYDFINDYDYYLNEIKKKVYLLFIYRKDTTLLVIPMERGAVKFNLISSEMFELIISTSKFYFDTLNYDLRIKVRHIKTTDVRGISKEEENYYTNYAKEIENFCNGNKDLQENAFKQIRFKLPNKSQPNVLRTKISDFRILIDLLCNPETGDHDNVPIDKRYHQQVNSLLTPIDEWRVYKPRKETFNKQIKTYRKTKELRWTNVDFQKYNFNDIDTENIETIEFQNMTIFDAEKEIPKCFQNMEFENLTTLNLKNCKIHEISDNIAQKLPVTLKSMDLSSNNIKTISTHISRLIQLEYLSLDDNLLLTNRNIPWLSLPSSIFQFHLKNTSIMEIPYEIYHLVNLQYLSISSWCLMNISWKDISQTIRKIFIKAALYLGDIVLTDKCNLEILDIEKTPLKEFDCSCLPPQLIELSLNYTLLTKFTCENAMPHLKHLSLSYNSLTTIPWKDLPASLETLCARNNSLKTIDNILHLINLTVISVGYNEIEYLSNDIASLQLLQALNFKKNLLFALPVGMENLQNLKDLHLESNKFNYEDGNLNENLWKRLPPKMEKLILDDNNLGELPCSLKTIKILSLSVESCGLRYICPHLITARRETQYFFIIKISNNPKLKNLSIIPTFIYSSQIAKDKAAENKSTFIMVTNNENFLVKTRRKPLFEFKKCELDDDQKEEEEPSFWCTCCVSCGNETNKKTIKQLMIMDFHLNIETKRDKEINIGTFNHIVSVHKTEQKLNPGEWKTNVITQLCQPCLNRLIKKIDDFREQVLRSRYIEGKTTKKRLKIGNDDGDKPISVQQCISVTPNTICKSSTSNNLGSTGNCYYSNSKPLAIGSLITLPLPQNSNVQYQDTNSFGTSCNTYPLTVGSHLQLSDSGKCYAHNYQQNSFIQGKEIKQPINNNQIRIDNQQYNSNYQQLHRDSWIKNDSYPVTYILPNDPYQYQNDYGDYSIKNDLTQLQPLCNTAAVSNHCTSVNKLPPANTLFINHRERHCREECSRISIIELYNILHSSKRL